MIKNIKNVALDIKNTSNDSAKTKIKRIDGMAYDGIDFDAKYVIPSGDCKQYEEQLKQFAYLNAPVNIGQDIQNREDYTLYGIHYALQKIEYMRGMYCYLSMRGATGYIVVRLKHINNTYPQHYFVVNIPEKQAEVLIRFATDKDKQEFIANQHIYFGGKTFEELIHSSEEKHRKAIIRSIQDDEQIKKFMDDIGFIIKHFAGAGINDVDSVGQENPLRLRIQSEEPFKHTFMAFFEAMEHGWLREMVNEFD